MKVLLAFDGSPHSQAALDAVVTRPWPPGSIIKLLTVIELPFAPTPESWSLPDSYYAQFEKAVQRAAQTALRAAAEQLQTAAVANELTVLTETQLGEARQVILAEATRWQADWIMLGAYSNHPWSRFWLGSVAHAVATLAPCSVEIVRGTEYANAVTGSQ